MTFEQLSVLKEKTALAGSVLDQSWTGIIQNNSDCKQSVFFIKKNSISSTIIK